MPLIVPEMTRTDQNWLNGRGCRHETRRGGGVLTAPAGWWSVRLRCAAAHASYEACVLICRATFVNRSDNFGRCASFSAKVLGLSLSTHVSSAIRQRGEHAQHTAGAAAEVRGIIMCRFHRRGRWCGLAVGMGVGPGTRLGVRVETDPYTDPRHRLTPQLNNAATARRSVPTDLFSLPLPSFWGCL
jgi:hypothetical protein